MAVVCGCLGLLGVGFSTLSAHAAPFPLAGLTGSTGSTTGGCAARRKSGGRPEPGSGSGLAASYSRYSSELQREEGIADQQRRCREQAERNGHVIDSPHEFSDEAVSGTKRNREGLNALLDAARRREFEAVYFFNLSRLARESVITMPLLKELVHVHKVRVVSVTEGVDSDREGWELIASIIAIQHERYIKDLGDNVLRGQESAVLAGHAVGDHCFGFRSVPVPGSETARRGRLAKPRMRYAIDNAEAAWVTRIFQWFVVDRQSIRWITRELNRQGAPKDHRSTTRHWHHQYVSRLLANRKYVGVWPWGEKKNTRNPLTGQVRQEERSDEDCTKWVRRLPDLQIVPTELFDQAQTLLAENQAKQAGRRRADGTLPWPEDGSSDGPPRHLLQRLIHCEACQGRFQVGGAGGGYLKCPNHASGVCDCKTQLPRARAERMILDEIGRRILANPVWKDAVLSAMRRSLREREESAPSELAECRRQLAEVEQKIGRLVDSVEAGLDVPDIGRRLAERRSEKAELQRRLDGLSRTQESQPPPPTKAWIEERIARLGETLAAAGPAAAYALRDLVGGRILVREIREEGRSRYRLQGRFTVELGVLTRVLADGGPDVAADRSDDVVREEIVVDFVEPDPRIEASERAKQLYDRGLLHVDIGRELGCGRSNVTRLLKFWHESRGLPMLDGRGRRSGLDRRHREPPP